MFLFYALYYITSFGLAGWLFVLWFIFAMTFLSYVIGCAVCYSLNRYGKLSDEKANNFYDLLDTFADGCYWLYTKIKDLFFRFVSFIKDNCPTFFRYIKKTYNNVKSFFVGLYKSFSS